MAGAVELLDELPTKDPRTATATTTATAADLFSAPAPATATSDPPTRADEIRGSPVTAADPASSATTTTSSLKDVKVAQPKAHVEVSNLPLLRSAPGRARVVDEDDFTLVRSRKYGMVRGRFPDKHAPSPPVLASDEEIPWGVKFGGNIRKMKQWSELRRSGTFGSGYMTYGSYGPDGHET